MENTEHWSERGWPDRHPWGCGGVKMDPAFPSLGPAPGQAVSMTSDDGAVPDVL